MADFALMNHFANYQVQNHHLVSSEFNLETFQIEGIIDWTFGKKEKNEFEVFL